MEEQEQTEDIQTHIKRLGDKTPIKITFDKDIMSHILLLPQSLKNIKPMCLYCNSVNEKDIYFCKRDRIFMCKHCVLKAHKVLLSHKNPEHEDIKIEIAIEE